MPPEMPPCHPPPPLLLDFIFHKQMVGFTTNSRLCQSFTLNLIYCDVDSFTVIIITLVVVFMGD